MIGLGQPVLYGVCHADAIEDVWTGEAAAGTLANVGQIGEGRTVVREHSVDLVGEDLHDDFEEG